MTLHNQKFYFGQTELLQATFLTLRDWLLEFDTNITETTKYGAPCFLYKGKILLYLWKDKKKQEPYLLFANGNLMNHPKLESGDRKRMKVYPIDINADLQLNELEAMVSEAIAVCIAKNKLKQSSS